MEQDLAFIFIYLIANNRDFDILKICLKSILLLIQFGNEQLYAIYN